MHSILFYDISVSSKFPSFRFYIDWTTYMYDSESPMMSNVLIVILNSPCQAHKDIDQKIKLSRFLVLSLEVQVIYWFSHFCWLLCMESVQLWWCRVESLISNFIAKWHIGVRRAFIDHCCVHRKLCFDMHWLQTSCQCARDIKYLNFVSHKTSIWIRRLVEKI